MSALNPWTGIIGAVGNIVDDLVTTDEERAKFALAERELDQRTELAQIGVNTEQVKHPSMFVAGARPGVIWVGVASLAWTFIIHPMLVWLWAVGQARGWFPAELAPPPTMDTTTLMVMVGSLLGVGGMRSFDKAKGTDTKRIGR